MNVPELHITPLVRLCAPQAILTRRELKVTMLKLEKR